MTRRRKFWGWGFEDQQPPHEQVEATAAGAREHLGFGPAEVERPVRLEDIELPPPRLERAGLPCRDLPELIRYERAAHAYGKSYRDVVRAFRGQFDNPPDAVAHPSDEAELERVLAWCEEADAAAIPFGGGTSVVGGVEPPADRPTVSIDLKAMDRVLEVDSDVARGADPGGCHRAAAWRSSCASTASRCGTSRSRSSTRRWAAGSPRAPVATTRPSTRTSTISSSRSARSRRAAGGRAGGCPAPGAGPSPDRMLIGSEGILGVITEAWMRVQDAPRFRESAAVLFDSFESGAQAVRALSQSGLHPSNCRLLDPGEAALTGAAPDDQALLVLGFESADHELGPWMARALELCADHGGRPRERRGESEGTWRDAFLQAPYLRDTLVAAGILAETFETAITWDRFAALVDGVREGLREALARRGRRDVPAHARLSGRRRALLHGARPGPARRTSSSSGPS